VDDGRLRPVIDLAAAIGLASATETEGGYLLTLAGRELALRTAALPEAAQVELIDAPDGPRGRVLEGVHKEKTIVRLTADDLAGSAHAKGAIRP
jgi:hypothetical protein